MSPLDEELHAALHGRAAALTPPPDPMAGIERRAAGIHRRRLATTVAGGVLAIAVAAVAVPSLLPGDPTASLTPTTQAPTPAPAPTTSITPTKVLPETPANALVSWPTRGAMESEVLGAAKAAWAQALQTTLNDLKVKVLFAGDTDSGVKFVMGQAWAPGAEHAQNVAYSEGGTNGPQPFIGPATPKDPVLLAFVFGSLPGTTTDLLVVVPNPLTGQVNYDADASGSFRPITGQDYLDGVVLIDRSKTATNDRLELFDGDGDLDNPTYRGPVAPLLCGVKECG